MKLIFELSGEHPDLPVAELETIGDVLERRTQVGIVQCADPGRVKRLALTHVVLEYLGECDANLNQITDLIRELSISSERPFAGRAKIISGCDPGTSRQELERMIGTLVNGHVSLERPEEEYRLILSDDRCYFGRVITRINRGEYDRRKPGNRNFFHPGVMMPRIARALVNISCVQPGEMLADPFCGTGGILLEGEIMGTSVIGSDIDPRMVEGSRCNVPDAELLIADSAYLPLKGASVDAVVTDLPYGQSVKVEAHSLEALYSDALSEIRRILRPGKRAVVVTHQDIRELASGILPLKNYFEQRVHKSLTRRICVFRR
jgi:tRNA (guanine10-N2)-dimethyltransferase